MAGSLVPRTKYGRTSGASVVRLARAWLTAQRVVRLVQVGMPLVELDRPDGLRVPG